MIKFGSWMCTQGMAESQTLDWRRVAVFTPLITAGVAIFLVYGRDLAHKQVMVVAILLFAVFSLLFQTIPTREASLPGAIRRIALLGLAAGLVLYIWLAGTKFFQQAPSVGLFLLIFLVIQIGLILVVRSASIR
jgi:hypothetical protein